MKRKESERENVTRLYIQRFMRLSFRIDVLFRL